jgi:serine phosphatase RsbU (regulator of sigma subunit)
MPHARCTKADQTRTVMTSEAIEIPASRPTTAVTPSRPGAAESTLPAEAGLAAELAEERHVALELQRAILPLHDEAFDLPGLRTMVRYLPASKAGRVGGDWYITADMPGGHVLVAIGDVAGHGLAAAAGMARLRGALAGLAITGSPPERLLGWLNDLVRHVAPEHTASVIAGYFDPASRTLTWAQAGHPPPVLIRGSWARPLDAPDGILLGAGEEEYASAVLALAPDDLLLLYSDGLIERRDRSIEEGLDALSAAVRGIADPELAIDAALRALGSTDAEDDTCLVALRVL